MSLSRRLWAELIGTWVLVLVGCGAVTATVTASKAGAANIGVGALFAIAMTFGIAVTTMIYAIGHISGCHINPAVSVALALTGRMPWSEAAAYVVAQLIGATGGALTLWAVFGAKAVGALGAPAVGAGFTAMQAYLAEAVGTFVLVFTIFGTAVDGRAPKGWAGLAIGLVVAGVIVAMGSVSGQGINPARSFGPYLVETLAGGSVNWVDFLLGYTLAPLIGGGAAAFAYDALAGTRAAEPAQQAAPAD